MDIIPEEIKHMIQSFLFTYPEVDRVDIRSANPKFVNYMKSIAVRTTKINDADVEFYVDDILHNEESPTIIGNNLHWYRNGVLHSEDDKPAVIYQDGDLRWFKDGYLHREDDKPAVVNQDGYLRWYKDGKLHREDDKPAVINRDGYRDGYQLCYKNGISYRVHLSSTINIASDYR